MIGCIDGCYIPIRKPANKIRTTYVNRHDMLSITLQGICDSNRRFIDVCVGSPSRIHDSRIFSLSPISDQLQEICHGRYHLLGDAAYPLRDYLITPFKDYGNMTAKQKKFNLAHSQTRVRIENTFGIMKQRFRQLTRLDFFLVERMSKFVLACCTLHNLCIELDDEWQEREDDEEDDDDETPAFEGERNAPSIPAGGSQSARNAALRRLGELKRESIANQLSS